MDDAIIGDVLINGGSPGHAMIISDIAVNKEGKKIYLLLQGFLPAQDIHVVKNLGNSQLSPWYVIDNEADIITPGGPSGLRH